MRIIFMGTPEFAVPSLDILVQNGYNVVAVITSTDKLGGRGKKKLLQSAVKKYAVEKNIPVLQPKNLKAPEFIEELQSYQADVQIVVAFRMLPVVVWDMPKYGTYNLHGSLLPKYRGAAPINWAVMNGEIETGVTSFKLQHAIDTGDMLFQEKLFISPDETVGEVHDRMMVLGAEVILKTIQAIETNTYELIKQDDSLVSKAPKIHPETCKINFDQDVEIIHNHIRGLSPYPTAWTKLDDLKLKVYRSKQEKAVHNIPIGSFITDNKSFLKIAVQNGFIHLLDVQLQGKKRMDVNSFLNGFKLSTSSIFEA